MPDEAGSDENSPFSDEKKDGETVPPKPHVSEIWLPGQEEHRAKLVSNGPPVEQMKVTDAGTGCRDNVLGVKPGPDARAVQAGIK